MTAAQTRQPHDPREQAERFVAEFQMKFSNALDEARAAATVTQSPAWQANYKAQRTAHEKTIKAFTDQIGNAVSAIQSSDTTEDDEKSISDGVKGMKEERIGYQAFRYRAVSNYKIAAENAMELRQETIRKASQAERDNPLINQGLHDAVALLVSKWPTISWDDEIGVVTVIDTTTGESLAAK